VLTGVLALSRTPNTDRIGPEDLVLLVFHAELGLGATVDFFGKQRLSTEYIKGARERMVARVGFNLSDPGSCYHLRVAGSHLGGRSCR